MGNISSRYRPPSCSRYRAGLHGREFVLTEQRPRMQSRAEVYRSVRRRCDLPGPPSAGARHARHVSCQLRHGVSRVRSGQRRTVGIIFHDAR